MGVNPARLLVVLIGRVYDSRMGAMEILAYVRELMLLGLVLLMVIVTLRAGGGDGGGSGRCCPEAQT